MRSKEEKRKIVIDLYKQGATIREMAKIAHLSFRDIKKIIDEEFPKRRELSPRIKALNLFMKGKSMMKVITSLNMPFEEAQIVEGQYLTMQNRSKLARLYTENEGDFSSIIEIFNFVKEENLSREEINRFIYHFRNNPNIQSKLDSLINQVFHVEHKKSILFSEISQLKKAKEDLLFRISQTMSQINEMKRNFNELTLAKSQLSKVVATQMNLVQMGTVKIEQLIQSAFDKIFNNYEPVISIMFLFVIDYLKNSPDSDLFAHFFDNNISDGQNTEFIDKCKSKLSEMSEQTMINFRNALYQIVRNGVNSKLS